MRLTERSAFDPALRNRSLLLPRGSISARTLPLMRRMDSRLRAKASDAAEQVQLGSISIRVHRPPSSVGLIPGLLWLHGGGYVMGTPAQDDALCVEVCSKLGVVVAAVDYRVAPEHPFPTPLHDCHDALEWLAAADGVDRERIVVGGASAGGGLAAALALLARDRKSVAPVFQLLSYPMLDDRTTVRSDVDDRFARLWNHRSNRFGWSAYLGAEPGGPSVDPLAAPARHDDLAGLPPAWIGVGALDIFHDEDLAYAARLRDAGVGCEVTVVPGAFHGFDSVAPAAPVTRRFREAQLAALSAALKL